jgi:hypothetical protein
MRRYGRDFGRYDHGYRLSPAEWGTGWGYDVRERRPDEYGYRIPDLPPDEWAWGFGPYERRTGWGGDARYPRWKSRERIDRGDPYGDRARHTPFRAHRVDPRDGRFARRWGYDAEYPEWWGRRVYPGRRHDGVPYDGEYWL